MAVPAGERSFFCSMNPNYFQTSHLTFVGICLLQENLEVIRTDEKLFHICPVEEARSLWGQYQTDQLVVNPRLLSIKISEIKHMPLGEVEGGLNG